MKPNTLLSTCLRAGFCLIILLSVHASHGQTVKTVSLIDGSIKEGYEETIPTRDVEIVEDGVIVTYTFHHMTMQPDNLYGGAYFLKMKGFGLMDIPGLPSVPTHMDSFTVPEGCTATVSVIDSSFVEIPLQLSPARQPLWINDTIGYNLDNVPPIKEYAGVFPHDIILGTECHQFRENPIFNVSFSPVKYGYKNKKAIVYNRIKYQVSFITQTNTKGKTNKRIKTSYGNTFLNNVTLNGAPVSSAQEGIRSQSSGGYEQKKDYLIISVPDYEDAVEPFAIWKRKMGYHVQTVYRTNWNPDSIIDFVHDVYNTCDNLAYLLIVGGNKKIPAKQIGIGVYGYQTDYYYGCINNTTYQEVCVGRIPVDTLEEACTVLEKIISYEQDPVDDEGFYRTALACAQFQDEKNHLNSSITIPDGYEDVRFTQTTEEMAIYLDSLGYDVNRVYNAKDSVVPAYWNYNDNGNVEIPDYLKTSSNFNWHGDRDDIKGYLEAGTFLAFYNGHGAFAYWDQPRYEGYDVTYYLNNQRKMPVVFSMTCSTGKFIHNGGQSFSESFLWKENGGSVGIISASDSTYQGYTDILGQGMIDAIWPVPGLRPNFRGINPNYSSHSAVYQLGDILRQGNKTLEESRYCTLYLYNDTALASGFRKHVREVFHCLGDPSMQIYTAKPTPFSNVIAEGSTTFCSVDLGSDSGTITFYNQQSDSVACFVGSHADYVGPTDSLVVCISGHNRIPYITTPESFQTYYIQNETVGGTKSFSSDTIKIGSNVTTAKPSGPVVFNGTHTTIIGRNVEITGETTIELGTEFEIRPE